MLLATLAECSRVVAASSGRLKKIGLLADCLRKLAASEIEIGVRYLCGDLRQGRIGLGPALLRDALGATPTEKARLTLHDVDRALAGIAEIAGKGSVVERRRLLCELFARATPDEQGFLFKLLLGELRQGALEGVMLEAVAEAARVPAASVRRAIMVAGAMAPVARVALTEGSPGLSRFVLTPLKPVKPMLAQPVEDPAAALSALGECALEYKLDGARVQVHKLGELVRAYTRQLNDVTERVPEIIEMVRVLPVRQIILDGETLVLRDDGSPEPFQVTMRRFGRKLDVEAVRRELPLRAFYFDCLHLDGTDLIDRDLRERFGAMSEALPGGLLIPRLVTKHPREADAFLQQALCRGHEGIMAKSMAAPYEAGNRGSGWLKIKPAHTLDLVVLGAEWGSGRRRGWLSNLHLAARDPEAGTFVMLGKTFKGLTDAMLGWQTRKLLELEVARNDHVVYVRPELVVEIAFNDIQASPHYPASMALRFARVKGYRIDKTAAEADTIDAVRAIFARQSARRTDRL